jgi:short-subunit dehydrogenase
MDNKKRLSDQVIVITGASSGFGRGAAIQFAAESACVVLAARREELLDELVDECEAAGGTAMAVPTDVSELSEVEDLADMVVGEFGRLDVWVNNAGAVAIGRFEDVPIQDHVKVIETDLLGTVYGSYFAMQKFRQQGEGILINVASVVGKVPMPYYSSYAAAKHGVVALSSAIRLELEVNKIDTIRVCTVLPTSTDTPFFEHAANYSGHEFLPTPPVYDPKDVIDVIVKLATDPEDEVAVGSAAKMAILAHNMAPGMTESRMAKETHKTLMEKAPLAIETEGSLQKPSLTGAGVHGTGSNKTD